MPPLALDIHLGLADNAGPFLVPSLDDPLPLRQLVWCHRLRMFGGAMHACVELVLEEACIAILPAYVAVLPICPVRCLWSLLPKIL